MPADHKPDPRLNPWREDIAAAHLRGEVKAPKYVTGEAMRVVAPVTALRRSPADGAMMDTQLLYGERFTAYEQRGDWLWGQAQMDDYVGYALAGDFVPAASKKNYESDHLVQAIRSFVYNAPDIKSRPRSVLSMGCRFRVTDRQGRFARIDDLGWMIADHIVPQDDIVDDPVAVAEQFLHAPYLWGGRESLGLDCSALVQIALMRAGYSCPRDTDMQETTLGQPVPVDFANTKLNAKLQDTLQDTLQGTLKRGDLVFWKGHVGLMQSAGDLLHANATHMKVVSEDFAAACARIAKTDGPVTSCRRLPPLSARR